MKLKVINGAGENRDMAKRRRERAEDFSPKFRRRRVRAPKQIQVTGYLTEELADDFDKYLEKFDMGISECLRWLIGDAVKKNRRPPGYPG